METHAKRSRVAARLPARGEASIVTIPGEGVSVEMSTEGD